MQTNTHSDPKPIPPAIPTGQELYDSIMGHIEPELTTSALPLLAEHYQNETPEEATARKQRYELAFERYDQAYDGYIQTLHAQADRYRRQSFAHVELKSREWDKGFLDQLHGAILEAE
ncbi:MAG: hypothetical protein AAB489_02470 [Patescibacteria group bacterium]